MRHGLRLALPLWLLPWLLCLALLSPPAQACADGGCVSAGPRLASISSTRAVLLNGLLGQLAGSSVNLGVADWQALASGELNLLPVLGALQAQLGVSSPTTALHSSIGLGQVLAAAASAATASGHTGVAAALGALQPQLALAAGTLRLGDLLVTDGGLGETRINALALVTGAVQLYNHRNLLTTPVPVGLSGSALGLGGLVQGVQLQAQVLEPPTYVCGPAGTGFHSAAMRVKLGIDLLALNIHTGMLTALVGVSSASLQLSHLDLYVEVARADGLLTAVDAVAGALTVQATPGVADLYLGVIPDALFFNRSRAVNPATDLQPGVVGALKINALNVAVTAKGSARGQAPSATPLAFSGPYPQTRTASTGAGFAHALVGSLVGSLSVGVSPGLGLLDAVVLPVLRTLVQGAVSPLLGQLLGGLVDPLLELLGLRLGEVDVTAGGAFRVCSLAGSVYADADHDARRGPAEAGTGLALYAKLVPATRPAGPAQAVAVVDAATGRYSFGPVGVGSYQVVINGSSAAASVAPAVPAGWLGTEAPGFVRSLTLATDLADQHFGAFHGSTVAGRVHQDTGDGGGTPHNGLRDGTETALPGRTLRLLNTGSPAEIARATSASDGSYLMWLPAAAAGAVQVASVGSAAWVLVGGSAGNTGGAYALPADATAFVAASGQRYAGVDFAMVPASRFDTEGQQAGPPGTVMFFGHRFVAGTAGLLSFSTQLGPADGSGPSVVLHADADCNQRIEADEPVLAAPLTVVAGQPVCLVARLSVPAQAVPGSRYALTVTARLAYAQHSLVGEHLRADLALVTDGSDAALRLSKQVDKALAASGDTLTYSIAYVNQGSAALQAVRLHDRTPAWTRFVSADCGPQPVAACSVVAMPPVGGEGAVEWRLDSPLAPAAQGSVRLTVRVQ
ncbi:hypothetical protein [Aquincola sp. J276]|uniref:hypothetical protein n=1 Tax=Aquincola sp. J276 TaxID=2898432 RepID=UPI002151AB0B|nr:hypothetical protein [Aquincola sp. J276]MCR5867817.1 DUF11 domain-containing protein [Aquincola sp. J276]